ncbi:MAG: ethanolamine utilization protein EutN [bacterium]|nr:ethanolamine utilization protein EutN [bacterium]
MRLARVVGNVVSTLKHETYEGKPLLLVEPVNPDGTPKGPATVAIDYVGAGEGEYVIMGGAPGQAKDVFKIEVAPIREMVMGIIDEVELNGEVVLRASDSDKPRAPKS